MELQQMKRIKAEPKPTELSPQENTKQETIEEEKPVEQSKAEFTNEQAAIIRLEGCHYDTLCKMIDDVIENERYVGCVMVDKDEKNKTINPYGKLIELFDSYIGKFKQEHFNYLKENKLLPSTEQQEKDQEEKIDKEEAEKQIEEIKQVKFFK